MPFASASPPPLRSPRAADFLGAAELMQRWDISRTTLWRWVRSGVPGTSVPLAPTRFGRMLRFRRAAVEDIEYCLAAASAPRPAVRRRRRSRVA